MYCKEPSPQSFSSHDSHIGTVSPDLRVLLVQMDDSTKDHQQSVMQWCQPGDTRNCVPAPYPSAIVRRSHRSRWARGPRRRWPTCYVAAPRRTWPGRSIWGREQGTACLSRRAESRRPAGAGTRWHMPWNNAPCQYVPAAFKHNRENRGTCSKAGALRSQNKRSRSRRNSCPNRNCKLGWGSVVVLHRRKDKSTGGRIQVRK